MLHEAVDAARQAFAGWTRKLIGRERSLLLDSIRAVASVVEGDVLHQADEELGLGSSLPTRRDASRSSATTPPSPSREHSLLS